MITRKPKSFSITYESGVTAEFADPRSGIAFYRLQWPALKAALQYLAEDSNEPVTLIDNESGDSLTATPEGRWL